MSIHWWPFRTTRKKTVRRPLATRPQFDTLEDRAVPTNNTFATASVITPPNARLDSTPVDQWTTIRDTVSAAAPDFYKLSVNAVFGLAVDMKTSRTGAGVTTEIYDSNQNLIFATHRVDAMGKTAYFSLPFSFGNEESEPSDGGVYLDLGPGTYYIKNSVGFGSNEFTMRVLTDTVYSAAVPEFNSNPGAPVSVYLDFDGHSSKSPTDYWVESKAPNGYSFPALNIRGDGHIGDAATFSPGERLYMANTWKMVAEDFAPFNINVTTKDVPLYVNNLPAGLRAIITNKDADTNWRPGAGGYAPLDGMSLYPGEGPAINYGRTDLADVLKRQGGLGANASILSGLGGTVTHEVAHAFGLNHQFGAKTSTPNLGPGPAGPVPVGLPSNLSGGTKFKIEDTLGTWVIGMNTPEPITNKPPILQNDMDVIAKPENRAGYRPDDAGNTRAIAVALTAANNSFKKNGVIEKSSDVDFYSFTAAGKTSISVDVPSRIADPNLITMIELHDANGNVVAQGVKVAGDRSYTNLHATLTVRAGNDAGTLQFGVAPGLVVGDVINVSWGVNFQIDERRAMRVTAVNGNAVTVANGYRFGLPAQGSVVLISKPLPTGQSTITVDNLAAGTYYLKVSGTGRRSTDDPNNFIENVGQYAIDIRTDVPAVNAPPVVTLPGDAFSQKAKEAATRLDANATVTDADSPDFNGGRLTVSITANGTTNDTLAIISDAVVSVNLIVGDISYNGDVIGTVTGGTAGTPLVVAFNSDKATPAAAQEILRRVTFANDAAAANIGQPRTISVVARDRQGSDSVAVTKVVTVTIPAQQVIRITFNRGLTVPINAPELLTSNDLQVVAPANGNLGPPPVEYTITQAPRNGVLVLAATAGVPLLPNLPPVQLGVGDKFEQGDIDSGRLAYRLTPGSAANSDQFSFTATDLISGTIPDTVFNIRVTRAAAPVAGVPAQPFGIQIGVASIGVAEATVDLYVTIDAAPTATTIGSNRLSFLGDPRDLRYDIISGPTYGSLNLPTTFTQQNINDNDLTYTAPKVADVPFGVTQDTFTYVVTDVSTGGVSDPITFTIEFKNPNDAPEFIAGESTVNLPTILPVGPHSSAARIQDIVEGIVNDPDDVTGQANGRGIAITGFDDLNGLWEYTLDGGISWDLIPSDVSNTNALLLSGIDTLQAVRFTADSDFNGSATYIFRLWDRSEGTNGELFDLTSTETDAFSLATGTVVQPVMAEARAPSFHPGPGVVVNEDAGLVVVPNWATNIEGDNLDSEIVFVVAADDGGGGNITFLTYPTISANGTLTFEVAPGSSGTAAFDVIITSAFSDSIVAKLTITVNSVNDAPTIAVGPNVQVASTASQVSLVGWATGISAGASDEASQTLSIDVSTDHPEFFDVQPALNLTTGTLTFTPNVNAVGTANVFLNLLDDGGTANGGVAGTVRSMTITISSGLPLATRPVAWVKQIYRDLLGRDADPQGIATWTNALAAGVGREDVARAILMSAEYSGIQVANLYRTLLRREPDAGGLNGHVAAMQSGVSLRSVKEAILASPEYFSTQGGGTGAGFVAALFRDVLGRNPDAATLAFYGEAIDRFQAMPLSVQALVGSDPRISLLAFVRTVAESIEADGLFVRDAFGRLLGREPDAIALHGFVAELQAGASEQDELVRILLSEEYYLRS